MPLDVQAVIFDCGGVLVDMRWDVARAIEAEHRLAAGTISRTLYRRGMGARRGRRLRS